MSLGKSECPSDAWGATAKPIMSAHIMLLANTANESGRALDRRGHRRAADLCYALAAWLDPEWDAPWFNRGIIAKVQGRWLDCRAYNVKATDLDPSFEGAWWNLGIAATALEDWPVARRAWSRCGVTIPLGEGPPDLNLGPVPIRVSPESAAEVVWCHRVDPARAVVTSVPLPDCGRTFGDVVLHDGEARGHRVLSGRELPVFNELQLLTPSPFRTFEAAVTAPTREDADALEASAVRREVAIEDWSSIRFMCASCSEGTPHEHEALSEKDRTWEPNRRFGIAAKTEASAAARLEHWCSGAEGRAVHSLECVFAH